jgi:hypothetical protein
MLQRLPFVEIVGNGLTYNRENVALTAAFYAVGETWAEDALPFTQVTTTLSVLGVGGWRLEGGRRDRWSAALRRRGEPC